MVGGVLGAVAGAVVTSQFTKSTDARVLGGVGGAAVGAAIGYNMDQRRCAMFAIAKEHNTEITVTSVIVPKGDLPAAATVAATSAAPTSATPFAAGNDTASAGLSVTLRDTGKQFATGSDKLTPEAESLFREVADQYAYGKQAAKLTAASSDNDRSAVEVLKTKRVLLVGHTDDSGNSADNANLSERRAAAVARVFQAEGVAAANLYFQGAGETLPIADNHTEAGRAANRRVEIVDLTDDVAFHKFLATRRQSLQYYRASDVPDDGRRGHRARPRQGQEDRQGQHRLRRFRRRAGHHPRCVARLRCRPRWAPPQRTAARQAPPPIARSCPPATQTVRAWPMA